MIRYKKIILTSISIILLIVVTPFLIIFGTNHWNEILNFFGIVSTSSAKLSFGENRDYLNSLAKEIGATLITEPSEDFGIDTKISDKSWAIDMAQSETESSNKTEEKDKNSSKKDSKTISEQSDNITTTNPLPYPKTMESHDGVIEDVHYGVYSDPAFVTLSSGAQVRNCTSYSNNLILERSKANLDFNVEINSDEPQVLIYHTHTTESFEPYTRNYYDASFYSKTTDKTKNIISVGDEICKTLEKNGIKTVHSTNTHDYPDYNAAYDLSYNTVTSMLKKYPSIKVVLDIHRDGIERADGVRLSPITEINGKRAAQIMIISCADYEDKSLGLPNFKKNLSFATKLQNQLETDYSSFARPVLFDYRNYNQALSTGSLLIEIGSHSNSLSEVQYSGKLLGQSLSNLFISLSKKS